MYDNPPACRHHIHPDNPHVPTRQSIYSGPRRYRLDVQCRQTDPAQRAARLRDRLVALLSPLTVAMIS